MTIYIEMTSKTININFDVELEDSHAGFVEYGALVTPCSRVQ